MGPCARKRRQMQQTLPGGWTASALPPSIHRRQRLPIRDATYGTQWHLLRSRNFSRLYRIFLNHVGSLRTLRDRRAASMSRGDSAPRCTPATGQWCGPQRLSQHGSRQTHMRLRDSSGVIVHVSHAYSSTDPARSTRQLLKRSSFGNLARYSWAPFCVGLSRPWLTPSP